MIFLHYEKIGTIKLIHVIDTFNTFKNVRPLKRLHSISRTFHNTEKSFCCNARYFITGCVGVKMHAKTFLHIYLQFHSSFSILVTVELLLYSVEYVQTN